MAEFKDVASNEDIQRIADAVRQATGTEDDLTIPELADKVSAIPNEQDATIEPDKVLKDEIGYSRHERIVGTIETYEGETEIEPTTIEQTVETAQKYVETDIKVKAIQDQSDATITPETVFVDEIGYNNYNKVIGTYDADLELMKSYQNLYINLNGGSVLTENEYNISKANCYNIIDILFGGTI